MSWQGSSVRVEDVRILDRSWHYRVRPACIGSEGRVMICKVLMIMVVIVGMQAERVLDEQCLIIGEMNGTYTFC
jgi:hypothetical protein